MHWRIFTNTQTPENAKKVLGWVLNELGISHEGETIERYSKGGFVCAFETIPAASSWPEIVIESLSLAQKIGRGWVLTGSIEHEIDAWSSDSTVKGIQNIHLAVENA